MAKSASSRLNGTPAHRCRRVMVFGGKGGAGKTTVAANLMVAGAMAGLKVVGVDFDSQKSLWDWHKDRERHPRSSQLAQVDVGHAKLDDWQDAVEQTTDYDLAMYDLPPGMDEAVIGSALSFAERMDLVLLPSNM